MSLVVWENNGGIGIIKLNRPEALNSLNEEVLSELEKAVSEADEDPEVRVIIITSEGRAFAAGADIAAMSTMSEKEAMQFGRLGQQVFRKIERLDKPTIAAVNGVAFGGGSELAMACDIRIASSKARFSQPEVKLGITPGYSATQRLPRIVGKAKAMELILTGDQLSAAEAEGIGLVNKVVPPEELMSQAEALAEKIINNAPLAVLYSKRAIKEGLEMDTASGIELESELFAKCFSTEDQKEGMKAFLENRKAEFKGK